MQGAIHLIFVVAVAVAEVCGCDGCVATGVSDSAASCCLGVKTWMYSLDESNGSSFHLYVYDYV